MRPVGPILTYVGITIAAAGFGVLIFSWGKVAALTAVPLQMPYLLSGGLVGLGLILCGLTLVNINAKRQDASARERQLGQVREVMAEIKALLAGEPAAADATPPEATDPAAARDEGATGDDGATEQIPPITVS